MAIVGKALISVCCQRPVDRVLDTASHEAPHQGRVRRGCRRPPRPVFSARHLAFVPSKEDLAAACMQLRARGVLPATATPAAQRSVACSSTDRPGGASATRSSEVKPDFRLSRVAFGCAGNRLVRRPNKWATRSPRPRARRRAQVSRRSIALTAFTVGCDETKAKKVVVHSASLRCTSVMAKVRKV